MLTKEASQEVRDYRRTAKLNRRFDCVQWPWVQTIRSYVRDLDAEQLRLDMGAGTGCPGP
mgnify:CR=1 FL=1